MRGVPAGTCRHVSTCLWPEGSNQPSSGIGVLEPPTRLDKELATRFCTRGYYVLHARISHLHARRAWPMRRCVRASGWRRWERGARAGWMRRTTRWWLWPQRGSPPSKTPNRAASPDSPPWHTSSSSSSSHRRCRSQICFIYSALMLALKRERGTCVGTSADRGACVCFGTSIARGASRFVGRKASVQHEC